MSANIRGNDAPATGGTEQGGTTAADQEGQALPRPPKRFVAFISYAHSDERVAAQLQKQIETYRLPTTLRGTVHGATVSQSGGRLGSVFRDRADLAAADSLNAAIRTALAESAALIVLCSPPAAQSRWVNEEVQLFRALNPGAPVLAAVVCGEPADAMPAALTEDGREPLAADLRQVGDGRKLGFFKIIAALASVPLDALIQRDAQRKLRRVMVVTAGTAIALLAAVAMMTYAIQQRNEAQVQRAEADRRRAQAEGLVEFMLTDLRDRLRGVGRLDIMRSAVGSALNSYGEGAARGALTPDSQGQLARLLHAVGEDEDRAARRDEAERSFRRAYAITAPLLADAPRDPDRIFNHAQSEYWLGYVAYNHANYAQTTVHWQRYHQLATRLLAVDPDRLRALRELGYAEGNLCSVAMVMEQQALERCRRALSAQMAVGRARPNDVDVQVSILNREGWLADAVEREHNQSPAANARAGMPYRTSQLARARRLSVGDPDNFDFREYLVSALFSVGAAQIRTGEMDSGRAHLIEAREQTAQMLDHDPANQSWARLARQIEQQLVRVRN